MERLFHCQLHFADEEVMFFFFTLDYVIIHLCIPTDVPGLFLHLCKFVSHLGWIAGYILKFYRSNEEILYAFA